MWCVKKGSFRYVVVFCRKRLGIPIFQRKMRLQFLKFTVIMAYKDFEG